MRLRISELGLRISAGAKFGSEIRSSNSQIGLRRRCRSRYRHENPLEDAVNIPGVFLEFNIELLDGLTTHAPRDKRATLRVVRDSVRLQTVFHLQHMLKVTEEPVRVEQLGQLRFG